MASNTMNSKIPTGTFQRPVQIKHSHEPSPSTIEQTSSAMPFFLRQPKISSDIGSRLIPIDVDLQAKKNMEEHSTNHYDIPGLLLRRGQTLTFTVTFNRNFDPDEHQLYVRLAIGSRSLISKGTQIRLLVDGTPSGNGWSAKRIPPEEDEDEKTKNNRVSLQINSPSDAIIGKYTLLLEIRPIETDVNELFSKQDLTLFLFEIDIYFLFNPWNRTDVCALSSSEQINEYVLNEHGQIYLGSADKPQSIPWYFGQFERPALLTALALLDRAQLPPQNRLDPSVILRILSAKICSNPGTNSGIFPSSFDTRMGSSSNHCYTSSSAILKQYLLNNGRSVQGGSGHNWQHAAVLCSLSRALGIPCRIVTVYNAACRTDGTENNDIHWDIKQRPLKQLNSDFICSSHVWNECWMRRNDIGTKEQEWQIIDSTPVLMCDGIRRTGPCSVSSLKKGDLGFRWDSPFLHSSINGNKNNWLVYPDGNMQLLDVQEDQIGIKMITRSLSKEFQAEDITEHYKKSTKSSHDKTSLSTRLNNDVDIESKLSGDIKFGDDIILELKAKNQSKETRTITTALTVWITSSIGQRLISSHDQPVKTLTLEAKKDDTIQLRINSEEYIHHGKQENIIMKYYIHSHIKETNQTFTKDENIIFNKEDFVKPILNEDVIEIGKPVFLGIQIANLFSRPLQNGSIHIDGLGINHILPVNRSFAPKESTILRTKIYPTRLGVSRLYITFVSSDVCSLIQSIPVEIVSEAIKKPEEPLLANSSKTEENKSEIEIQEKEVIFPTTISDTPHQSPIEEEIKPSIIVEEATEEKNSIQANTVENEDDDDVEEAYLKQRPTLLQPNTGIKSLLSHDSTLSLDKDIMSVDSLDIATDRHPQLDNNNHQ